MRPPRALRTARANASYARSWESSFDFLTNGNRGNDTLDAMRGSGRLVGDYSATIDQIEQAAATAYKGPRGLRWG